MFNTKQTHLQPLPVKEGRKGFTLVELIVVVTILAILATIGFVSYSSYLTGVRDTNRISQLSSISDGLNLYSTKNSLPLPEDSVEILAGTDNIIAYQGYAGSNTLETIDFTKGGQDPKDDTYFSYYLTKDRKYFQLMAFLEEADSLAFNKTSPLRREIEGNFALVKTTHAGDYEDRYPTVTGKKLGILTDTENTPIQEISDIITAGELVLTDLNTEYIGYLTDVDFLEGASILSINPKASCKRIKQLKGSSSDGMYEINPSGEEDAEFDVYCDMTTDGGGWTLTTMITEGYLPDYDAISSAYLAGENYYQDDIKIANKYLLDTNKLISEFAVDYQYGGLGDYTMNTEYIAYMTAPTTYQGLSLVADTIGNTYDNITVGDNVITITGTDYVSENIPNDIDLKCNTTDYTTIESMHSNNFNMRNLSATLKVFFGYSACNSTEGSFSARFIGGASTVELLSKDSDTDYEAESLRYWLR